ncbi:uncharacterized protein GJ701_000383 [Geothlypis trichas]
MWNVELWSSSSQEEHSQTCTTSRVRCWKQGPAKEGRLEVLSLPQRIWHKCRGGEGLSSRKAAEVMTQNKHHREGVPALFYLEAFSPVHHGSPQESSELDCFQISLYYSV